MRNALIVAGKELGLYVTSPMAYVVTAIFLALSGAFFSTYLAATNYSDTSITGFLDAGQVLILLFASILTMRLVSEEKKSGTWEMMLTAPVMDSEIVFGKFIGSLAVLFGMLVLTLYYVLLLVMYGTPDMGPIVTSYIGLLLLGGACLSVGLFASTLTSNQIVSAVVAGGILFALWFLGSLGGLTTGALKSVLLYLSLSHHFPSFASGVIDTRDVLYYLTVAALFLYLSIRSVEAGRWK